MERERERGCLLALETRRRWTSRDRVLLRHRACTWELGCGGGNNGRVCPNVTARVVSKCGCLAWEVETRSDGGSVRQLRWLLLTRGSVAGEKRRILEITRLREACGGLKREGAWANQRGGGAQPQTRRCGHDALQPLKMPDQISSSQEAHRLHAEVQPNCSVAPGLMGD